MTHRISQLILCIALTFSVGCIADIGPAGDGFSTGGGVGGPGGGGGPGGPGGEPEPAACIGDGNAGAACEVSGDCASPQVCVDGICIAPRDPDKTCNEIEGIYCQNEGEVCVAGICLQNPGACETSDQCPLGYLCSSGTCQPERDGTVCADPGPGPDLSGTYTVNSTLHLRDGLPGFVDGFLGVVEDMRDIANGKIDLDLPSAVEFVVGGLIAGVIRAYIPPWAIDLVTALGDVSDMIDTMKVESTMTLEGTECSGSYRVTDEWLYIIFDYQGREMRYRPDQLPNGVSIKPSNFSAYYDCGQLLFDKHSIKDSLSHLIRFLVDTVAEAVTGQPNVEQAIAGMVDCVGIGYELEAAAGCIGAFGFCAPVASVAIPACQAIVMGGAAKLGQEIDKASVKLSVIKRKGAVTASDPSSMTDGRWYGSLIGNDFPGEFSMVKR